MFEPDDLDDEYLEFQELDSNGKPISKPDVDELHQNYDSPSAEDNDKHIGIKVLLPKEGEK